MFSLEIALFSTLICALYSLREKIGLAPFYGSIGLFEAFLFFAGQSSASINGWDVPSTPA